VNVDLCKIWPGYKGFRIGYFQGVRIKSKLRNSG